MAVNKEQLLLFKALLTRLLTPLVPRHPEAPDKFPYHSPISKNPTEAKSLITNGTQHHLTPFFRQVQISLYFQWKRWTLVLFNLQVLGVGNMAYLDIGNRRHQMCNNQS